ncbi:MAG: MoxR family ATPase [Clostridiaceae bacterium]|jgi:MoxR-like ATPase|nr:MoxR family ATPase [Oscillospiraceae bacterium]NLO62586.1 MoxR family ATPase [Clostridiaceae bacterium]
MVEESFPDPPSPFSEVRNFCNQVIANISRVIVGKDSEIVLLLTALLTGGHVLLDDVPGTGKTKLAKTLARSLDVPFKRIQFTIDLLPSDLTGIHFFDRKKDEFVFRPGPLFTNILLADEINRATARTQSSLLECMEERQITVDGKTFPLSVPFFVIATQNPVETQGTFPLPEAQLDRFLLRLTMDYPDRAEGLRILDRFHATDPFSELQPVGNAADIVNATAVIETVFAHELVRNYILDLIEATRDREDILLGASPRASIALLKTAKSYAALHGRCFVTPDDVKALFIPVIGHRLILQATGSALSMIGFGRAQARSRDILSRILDTVPCPTEDFRP